MLSEAKSDTCAGQEDTERGEKESKDHHQGHPGESGLCWWQRIKADSPMDTAHCWVPWTQTKEDATSPDQAPKSLLGLCKCSSGQSSRLLVFSSVLAKLLKKSN